MNQKPFPVSVVDTETGEEVILPKIWQPIRSEGYVYLDNPMAYRTLVDKNSGHFTCEGQSQGSILKFTLLNFNKVEVRPSEEYKEPAKFTEIVMLDEGGFLATNAFGGATAENLDKFMNLLQIKEQVPVPLYNITCTLEKTTTKKGFTFFIGHFTGERKTEQEWEQLKEFIQAHPQALNMFNHLPNIDNE